MAVEVDMDDEEDMESSIPEEERVELWEKSELIRKQLQLPALSMAWTLS